MLQSARFASPGFWVFLLLSAVLTSCATAPMVAPESDRAVPSSAPMPVPTPQGVMAETAPGDVVTAGEAVTPAADLQMVRTAQMRLEVESVTEAVEQVEAIARQHQGDIVGLQEQVPQIRETSQWEGNSRLHTAILTLRVPQAQLDATLDALTPLGTVQNQSITAEDVSTQLVDYQARLKNLRQTEEMLLNIMKRAGDMADVLRVAQEVSNVRQSIETLDAQLANLQTQVAYSMVTVYVAEAVPTLAVQPPLGEAIAVTWQQASHSVRQFTLTLLKLLTWLAAYSPYLMIILLAAWFYRQQATAPRRVSTPTDTSEG